METILMLSRSPASKWMWSLPADCSKDLRNLLGALLDINPGRRNFFPPPFPLFFKNKYSHSNR